jgi:hypothetical protein
MPVASSDQQRKTRRVTPDRPSLLQSPAAVRSPWRRETRPSRAGRVESPGSGRPASKFPACARSGRTGQPGTVITRGTTFENRSNLAESFLSQVVSRYEGTRLGRQELSAEILDDIPRIQQRGCHRAPPPSMGVRKGPAQLGRRAVAAGNSDQARAIAPITKGAATLVRSAFRGNLIRE